MISTYRPAEPALSAGVEDIDPTLLRDTQAYLACCGQGGQPPPRLAEAWERFYLVFAPLIRAHILVHRLSEADCNDCIQEVWKEVVGKLCHFRYDPGRARLCDWLWVVCRNKAVDVIRRRARHPADGLDEVGQGLVDPETDPAAESERRETRALVRRAVRALARRVSARSFRVLYLRWFEGRSVPEIAATLGLTPKQVRSRHYWMKRELRRLLEEPSGRIVRADTPAGLMDC